MQKTVADQMVVVVPTETDSLADLWLLLMVLLKMAIS